MDLNDFHLLSGAIESIVQSAALIVTGVWVYRRFIRTREDRAKIEFDVDLKLLGLHDNKYLVEVRAGLKNIGAVRHYVNNFACDVLILKNSDPVVYGDERINNQVLFTKHNPPSARNTSDKAAKIIWIPHEWHKTFIDAGVHQQYTYLTSVPADTAFISVYSHFYYADRSLPGETDSDDEATKNKKKRKEFDFQTAQRTFSVEELLKPLAQQAAV